MSFLVEVNKWLLYQLHADKIEVSKVMNKMYSLLIIIIDAYIRKVIKIKYFHIIFECLMKWIFISC